MNPYQSPKIGERPSRIFKEPSRSYTRSVRLLLLIPACLAHFYFLAMLISWSRSWYSGWIVPKTLREHLMYAGAACCVAGSALIAYGLLRNHHRTVMASFVTTAVVFSLMIAAEVFA